MFVKWFVGFDLDNLRCILFDNKWLAASDQLMINDQWSQRTQSRPCLCRRCFTYSFISLTTMRLFFSLLSVLRRAFLQPPMSPHPLTIQKHLFLNSSQSWSPSLHILLTPGGCPPGLCMAPDGSLQVRPLSSLDINTSLLSAHRGLTWVHPPLTTWGQNWVVTRGRRLLSSSLQRGWDPTSQEYWGHTIVGCHKLCSESFLSPL